MGTSIASANFIGLDGLPKRVTLIIAQEDAPRSRGDGSYVVDPEPKVVTSDEDGLLSVELEQGSKVRIAIEGTTYVRSITVPSIPAFNLLQEMSDAPDSFTIQELPALISRRSF